MVKSFLFGFGLRSASGESGAESGEKRIVNGAGAQRRRRAADRSPLQLRPIYCRS